MPLARDENGGGTESDGSKSIKYCSHCYKNGQFTMPDITLTEMKQRVRNKLVEFGFPSLLTGLFTFRMGKLERWSGMQAVNEDK
jgi:hypothetical protein